MPYVYMRFTFDKRWTCDFTNQFTRQCVRRLHFSDAEKIRELAQRGKALTDLSSKNNFKHGIRNGGRSDREPCGSDHLHVSRVLTAKLTNESCVER
jgi:hypothetical protein